MNASTAMAREPGTPVRTLARVAGACQLAEAITATFGQVIVLGKLVVSGNAPATAANILAHERLYWAGFSSSLIASMLGLTWAFLMYDLLRAVNRRLAQFALLVMVMACAMQALTSLLYIAPLIVLQGGSLLSALTPAQSQALAALLLRLSSYAFDIHTAYFGIWCILTGALIFKSTFLPRILGILLTVAGLGWSIYVCPPVALPLFPVIAGLSALGEIPLEFWLMLKGVNDQRWREQAHAAGI